MSSGRPRIAVVHLVWAPAGPRELEGFLLAYRRHTAGVEHRLVVIFNGFEGLDDPRLLEAERIVEGVDHERVVVPHPMLDLAAYRYAAREIDLPLLCFLNSYSRPLVDGWLSLLAAPLSRPDIGLTGTGGTYESAYSAAPFWLRRRRRRDFDPFPNPHLRTNGFMLERQLMLDLDWPMSNAKASAWALESGKRSISRQVWERGLDVLVMGADGDAYACERWHASSTFRSGGQRKLLVADNRTLQYDGADIAMKQRLEQMAWGETGQSECPAPIRRVNDR